MARGSRRILGTMAGKKIFITGMAGYLGGNLCRELEHCDWCEKFYGMDLKKPLYKYDKCEFRQMDNNDPALVDWVKEIRPEVMIHLAYVLQELHDVELMHHINFDGSRNALLAAAAGGVKQVLVASSGTAYGAWPDNPPRLKEDAVLRPNPGFHYAVDKVRIEELCREFSVAHPGVVMSIIRPCVVYGPFVNNYISDLLDHYLILGIRGFDPPLQFVHEDDVRAAILRIVEKDAGGVFNIAPEDTITMNEIIETTRRPHVLLPDWLVRQAVQLTWSLRLPLFNFSPAFLDYIRYPWVVEPSRLINELGFKYNYSSRETVEIMLRAKGWLP